MLHKSHLTLVSLKRLGVFYLLKLFNMEELVKVVKNTAMVSTSIISEWFAIEHISVIKLIDKYKDDFLDFWNIELWKEVIKYHLKWRLKKSKIYYLNENQYLLLWTYLKNSEEARGFKKKLIKSFSKLKNIADLLENHKLSDEYKIARLEWKVIRRSFTDILKELKIYAKIQNPYANTNFIYSTYTKVINNNLFNINWSYKNIREKCNSNQLTSLKDLENKLWNIIIEKIDNKTPYKEIYYIIKEKMEAYCDIFWKTEVVENELLIKN